MAAQYLLPCDCGETTEIETSQAGQQINCRHCGASVLAPTLRGMRQLEPVPSEPTAVQSKPSWSRTQGVLFATGIGLLFVSLAVSAVLLYHRNQLKTDKPEVGPPAPPDQAIDQTEPAVLLVQWRRLIEKSTLGEWQPKEFVYERERERMINTTLLVIAGLAALGVVLAMAAVLAKRKPAPASPAAKA